MQSIITKESTIHFNESCYKALNNYLQEYNPSIIFVLVDENTHEHCLPKFLSQLKTEVGIEILEIESGEHTKTIETCVNLWNVLSELDADRKSLLINLGGGVITDLGGFVASTFKRGIAYINVPASLLAMVDASVGGKTGVDLNHLKNQVGVINTGEMVLIDTAFLSTLPENEFRSGMAEMLKHGLIHSEDYWKKMVSYDLSNYDQLNELIYESVIIKNNVVTKDPTEQNLRKTLNYGHTLGHAIESYFLNHSTKKTLLHGEAIAIGMILETYISTKLLDFPEEKLDEISSHILSLYSSTSMDKNDYQSIIELLKYDKKNEHGKINFVLLKDIGKHKINVQVDNNIILEAFEYYAKQFKVN